MEWELLINPVVGGIIGYGTNYLAIKMLFRPHEAKYIGKMQVPFTPGLIPKEKATLARQMGEITEDYLLTQDMLVDTLTGPKVEEVFLKLARDIPKRMEEGGQTVGQVAQAILGDDLPANRAWAISQMASETIKMLASKEVTALVIPAVSSLASQTMQGQIAIGLSNDTISEHLRAFALEALEGDTATAHIYAKLDDLEDKLYSLLRSNAADIGKAIIGAIGDAEEADNIKETLQHWIDENFNPMVSMFIKIDKIYEGIIEFAKEALEDPERNKKFGDLLCTAMKGIKESEPDYKDKIMALIKGQISKENVDLLLAIIVEELRGKEDAINTQVEKWLYHQWGQMIHTDGFLELVEEVIKQLMSLIEKTPISKLSNLLPASVISQVNKAVFSYYTKTIQNNSASVAQVMNISQLVESKIKAFSSAEAERLILSVVKKQLRGITWIGALLGAMIGLLANFI